MGEGCPGSLAYSCPSLLYIVPSSGMGQKSLWNDGLNHQARMKQFIKQESSSKERQCTYLWPTFTSKGDKKIRITFWIWWLTVNKRGFGFHQPPYKRHSGFGSLPTGRMLSCYGKTVRIQSCTLKTKETFLLACGLKMQAYALKGSRSSCEFLQLL